jgi:tetratricopeptide (TPR) repeat protein
VYAGTDGNTITQLLGEMMNLRRTAEAVSAADEAVAQRPTDVVFLQRVASVFAARGEWAAASRFLQRAFDVRPEVAIAQRYLDALMGQRPPQTRTAEDVLNRMGAEVLTSPGLLAASAMVHVQRSRMQEAERDATAAFDLVSGNPTMLMVWHTTMTRAFGDAAGYQAYLRRLAAAKAVTPLKDWPLLFLAMTQTRDPATSPMAIESLNALANTGQPAEVRLSAMRAIGTTLYSYGDHSQAVEIWQTALRVFPDDWEMNNNLAYTLTEHLGRPEEALPFAMKALELNPRASSVHDTVGWTLHKAGRNDEAVEHLWIAMRLSGDAAEQAGVVQHLLAAEVARGEKANAERWLTYLDRLTAESPWLDERIRLAAEEWRAKIDSLP